MTPQPLSSGSQSLGQSLRLLARLLTFRTSREELLALNWRDLLVGLVLTWLVGIGRYWDNPRVELLQKLGLGSVIYVFILTTFLFLVIWPLRPRDWTWFRLLAFVTFTSPPGFLYAIPVQVIFPEPGLETANAINVGFLAIVSVWRVSLLIFYLCRLGKLNIGFAVLGTAVPIFVLIFILAALNLDRVVFNIMGGIPPESVSPNDGIYIVLFVISMAAYMLIVPLLVGYGLVSLFRYLADDDEPVGGTNVTNAVSNDEDTTN